MRRLRRARNRHIRTARRLARRIVTTGAFAGTFCLAPFTGPARSAETPACDPHRIAVAEDADKDLLTDREELVLGYLPFRADQNRNEVADGAELATRCARALAQLPSHTQVTDDRQPFKQEMLVFGLEICDVCGEAVNMGVIRVVNPALGLTVEIPLMASHSMEHGSFSYSGQIHEGRVDVVRLARALGVRFPCESNEHQLPLAHGIEGLGRIAPDANDLDGDLLADSEELAAGLNLYDVDQDRNLVPDGMQLARRCAEIIDRLPAVEPDESGAVSVYKVSYLMRGLEWCEVCGQSVNMGYWQIVNTAAGKTVEVPEIARHFMEHGSFSSLGTLHGGSRVDVATLLETIGWPIECGDLGTTYPPGDLNEDCRVDADDFVELVNWWLNSTEPDNQITD
ncbi:MAG: hypothetical protein RBR19_02345 [Sedimentisphaerales bacterium]|nr:hypothetical protein [Sedimentisphaerales bacterium]